MVDVPIFLSVPCEILNLISNYKRKIKGIINRKTASSNTKYEVVLCSMNHPPQAFFATVLVTIQDGANGDTAKHYLTAEINSNFKIFLQTLKLITSVS